ncbi:alpha-D-glucosidase (maltase) (alpha-amylase) (MALT) (MAZS) [Yamadazyma tenuis]|uniref:Alpha-glucosidase n=1 Tax=Candida tenuis (strain ATCC 10573 / BCRC 21748 / CBS 615 / JCM 9827 / NBRC 10315 / NRRL Y-1498 / VKM Y-70) TaxID=590646 RepID=G3B961_CANTC|nr:uncharacterized protein CANTEDRAFT_108351 [Yamadazyma tenuis ATCC 10573]EGV62471.1 hypothetical protein CANTEDRAFT_108351 [Yamadazyma tenuis ATCC 10573]WEJ93757.1 alpha-D-glucosidase (maltase) (alpha-amylase) (MALT) (MAZS) [Yamadazyma tenuis]
MTINYKWWKDATIYQVWPASFKDSNGDGIGDIPGIVSKLDHIKNLGADIIWLSPMYDSPQNDMGYDISDYESVYPKYGTLEDMDILIDQIHKRGMRLILDLVINHTAAEHKWFQESKSSKTNPKRDWYIWKPPKYDSKGNRQPPNNWVSYFSGSAWEYDETTGEYYLHLFAKNQPDLNWENEHTRNALYKSALSFWFDKGIDGFRIDTAGMYSKDQRFLDAPIVFPDREFQPCKLYHQNGPRIHEFHQEMFKRVTSKYDAMTVGEVGHSSHDEVLKYVGAGRGEMNMLFLFDMVELGSDPRDRFIYNGYNLPDLKTAVTNQAEFIGTEGWTTVFNENHDQPRSVTRFGNDDPKWRVQSGKLLALLMSSLSGTLFLYQGQEIGMTNVPKEWPIEEYKDINSMNYYNELLQEGASDERIAQFMKVLNLVARDNARTPVQWDASAHAGFSTGKPWMRVNDNYPDINAESQYNDPHSLYNFWKSCLSLRKQHKDLFVYGDLEILDFDNQKTFSFLKKSDDKTVLVVLNFTDKEIDFEPLVKGDLKLLHSNYTKVSQQLEPYEGRVYSVY